MKKTVKKNKDGSITETYKLSGDDLKDLKSLEDLKTKMGVAETETNADLTQLEELTADLQRTRADFENYRKQVEAQKASAMQATKMATVVKILPLLDDIDRGISTYPKELGALKGSLAKILKELELEKVPSDEGVEFNPDVHDAVMVEGDGEKEVIAEVLRPGYYYEGVILRPAMVKVKKV